MPEIVANSVLPALRRPITLQTSDGLTLVGELAKPLDRPPLATIVCVHPLPTAAGMMDSHVLRKMAWRLPALAHMAILRFNTRGTSSAAGTSEGAFDEGEAEGLDLAAALQFVRDSQLPQPWVLGWSFGTDVILKHALRARTEQGIQGAILLSPPLRFSQESDLDNWAASQLPLLALVPELDDYLQPPEALQRFSRVPQAQVIGVAGAKHLWVGEKAVSVALNLIVAAVAPQLSPLPREWDGPMERWNDLDKTTN
ncbi:MAG: alpha/beta hydrolase [Actinomycetota bacterium]|nr:alpha/beta hydrolase [Actinomycetota bacterium]